jgi:glucose-1-phosphate adenylyltransferase
MKKEVIAMLLAGGAGSRLNILARHRAKPAIPFGGIYRIIDFTMSNIANSSIDVVGVLTQYKPLSLMEHIDNGNPWDMFGRTRLVEILPPKTGEASSDWYKGTSDAVYQNAAFIDDFSPELVLIVSGDHIYHMNYAELIAYHCEKNADATVCLIPVPLKDAHHFGIAETVRTGRIRTWIEKPKKPQSNLASMGIYVFTTSVLMKALTKTARGNGVDFAKNVIPYLLKKHRVFGYEFGGYWRDVGTIAAYWDANMDLLTKNGEPNIGSWRVKTNPHVKGEIGDRPSAYFGRTARVRNSLISRGCIVEGNVSHSVLSPGVWVCRNATVSDSIIFHDTVIGSGASVEKCIVDKAVVIGNSARLGHGAMRVNKRYPKHVSTGITVVGKKAHIAARISVGKNCIVHPEAYVKRNCSSGNTK